MRCAGYSVGPAGGTGLLLARGVGLALGALWPLIVFARVGRLPVLGWVLEVAWLVLAATVWALAKLGGRR